MLPKLYTEHEHIGLIFVYHSSRSKLEEPFVKNDVPISQQPNREKKKMKKNKTVKYRNKAGEMLTERGESLMKKKNNKMFFFILLLQNKTKKTQPIRLFKSVLYIILFLTFCSKLGVSEPESGVGFAN